MGSIYRRGQAWWSQVYVNGVAMRESCRTKDRAEAKRVLAEREAQDVKGQRIPIAKTTWTEAAEALLAHYRAYGTRDPPEASYRLRNLGRYFQGYRLADIDGSVPDLLTRVLDRKSEFIAIHEESKDKIMQHDGLRKTNGLPREPLDASAPGEMLALDLLGVLLPNFMGLQTQMPLIHASVIGVKS